MKDIRDIAASLAPDDPGCAKDILYFLLDNHLFGCDIVLDGSSVLCDDGSWSDLYARGRTFLDYRKETAGKKAAFLAAFLSENFPATASRLTLFFNEADTPVTVRYRLLDWMAGSIHKEVHCLSSDEAERLVVKMNSEAPLQAVSAFCLFLGWIRRNYPDTGYRVDIIPPARRSFSTAGQAYSIKTVAYLFYYVFSEEGIRQEQLLEKACRSRTAAHAWTYLCIHMVSALRDTDLERIPHPVLPCPPDEFLAEAANGSVASDTCSKALKLMMERLGYLHMKPHKVMAHRNIEDVFLSIPQSMEHHFGLLFLICEAHFQTSSGSAGDDGPLFRRVSSYSRIRACLGENIGALFLERDASPIALAKSYLQLVELEGARTGAGQRLSAVNGYMLASMARSHKGGPEGFAVTTAAYLRDFGLGIISPEATVRAMFDRGILSCLPSMLLDLITDGAYRALDFSQQAVMLDGLGFTPLEVEKMMELFLEARARCKEAVKDALSGFPGGERKTAAAKALERIAGYQAAGKEPDILCLMTALGETCPDPARTNCILCPYRICTRAAVYHAAGELHRLLRLSRQAATPGERKKHRLLAQQCLLPMVQLAADITGETYGAGASAQLLSLLETIIKKFGDKEAGNGYTAP